MSAFVPRLYPDICTLCFACAAIAAHFKKEWFIVDLAIIKKIEDMIGYGYIVLRQFPKSEKFVLGADIRQSMIELLSLAIRCAKRYHKKTSLQDMDIELQKLKGVIRISKELGFISFKHYENWSKYLVEIGKMLGGWIKSAQPA